MFSGKWGRGIAIFLYISVGADLLLGIGLDAFAQWPPDQIIQHIIVDAILLCYAYFSYNNKLNPRGES